MTIPDVDICACCAPHVDRTGEIGLIKLTNVQAHRGGVRVNLLAGDRALWDYREKEASVKAISVLLSAKEALVADAVGTAEAGELPADRTADDPEPGAHPGQGGRRTGRFRESRFL